MNKKYFSKRIAKQPLIKKYSSKTDKELYKELESVRYTFIKVL
jgi:hypothetical protein